MKLVSLILAGAVSSAAYAGTGKYVGTGVWTNHNERSETPYRTTADIAATKDGKEVVIRVEAAWQKEGKTQTEAYTLIKRFKNATHFDVYTKIKAEDKEQLVGNGHCQEIASDKEKSKYCVAAYTHMGFNVFSRGLESDKTQVISRTGTVVKLNKRGRIQEAHTFLEQFAPAS